MSTLATGSIKEEKLIKYHIRHDGLTTAEIQDVLMVVHEEGLHIDIDAWQNRAGCNKAWGFAQQKEMLKKYLKINMGYENPEEIVDRIICIKQDKKCEYDISIIDINNEE
jgi:hypothetical protein